MGKDRYKEGMYPCGRERMVRNYSIERSSVSCLCFQNRLTSVRFLVALAPCPSGGGLRRNARRRLFVIRGEVVFERRPLPRGTGTDPHPLLVDEPGWLPESVCPDVGQRVSGPQAFEVREKEKGRAAAGQARRGGEEMAHPGGACGDQKETEVPDVILIN